MHSLCPRGHWFPGIVSTPPFTIIQIVNVGRDAGALPALTRFGRDELGVRMTSATHCLSASGAAILNVVGWNQREPRPGSRGPFCSDNLNINSAARLGNTGCQIN